MGVNSLPSAWRTNLRTGAIQDRDLRFYLDPRGVEYPDLETGSAVYSLAREDNLIDRGNCESATGPAMLGETPTDNGNGTATLQDTAIKHGGNYSIKWNKDTAAAGGNAIYYFADNLNLTDMHDFVAGETYEFSIWVYISSASGPQASEFEFRFFQSTDGLSFTVTDTIAATVQDEWEELTLTVTLEADTVGCVPFIRTASAAAQNEYINFDDLRVSTHTVPGSHYLSSGYIETLCPMTEKFTLRIKFKPNFAYTTASDQWVYGWAVSETQYLRIRYVPASDLFLLEWRDGGTSRYLQTPQYDDGTTFRNINQWITLTAAIDLSTGTTAGSALWMNKTQDDTAWVGAIDAKTTEFNKAQIRAYAGFLGNVDIAYALLIPNKVATDAEVQNDFKDVANEEIFWSLDGHGTGKTRCNVSPFFTRYDVYKGVTAKLAASHGTNTLGFTLKNLQGEFSDDQYAAFVPTSFQYNGTSSQAYLTRRMGASLESWYGGDFEHLYVGRLTEAGLRRSSMNPRISEVEGSLEDGIGDIDRTFETNGRKYDSYDIVDATESNSLFHTIAHLADRTNVQYLANNSFENADITLSWLVTAGGTLNKDAADGFFGSASAELIPGAAAEQMYQTVTFTGSRKLNVGETYTAWCWLKSAGAASGGANFIRIVEYDDAVLKDSTSSVYVLAGGEGYKLAFVSHTITDSDSDRLRVELGGDAGDTINIDGFMHVPVKSAYNYFAVNAANGVAGVESADDASSISWPWFGIDAVAVDIQHPWRRVEEGTSIWENLKSLANASGPKYCGMSEANTLTLKAILQTDYSDDVPIDTWTTARQNIGVYLDNYAANKLIGHGVKIVKATNGRLVWLASSTGNFADSNGDNVLEESVADDAYWPAPADYPEYWAQYGTSGDRWVQRNLTIWPENRLEWFEAGTMPASILPYWTEAYNTSYRTMATSKRDKIIGLQNADLIHKLSDTGDGQGGFTETTFDVDSKAGAAHILLRNEIGSTKTLVECLIVAAPVYMYEGDEGFINDGHVDWNDIGENGERLLEFGGLDVVDGTSGGQLDQLADFMWKDKGKRKHVYALSFTGTTHDISPSDNYTINIGNAGETEYITSRAEVISVRMEQQAGSLGVTQVLLRELEEAWKYDSNVVSRFNARGVLVQSPSTGAVVTVGSEYSTVNTDYRISVGDTSAEDVINAAIDYVSGAFGGGKVLLSKGTYNTDGAIVLKEKVALFGGGAQTIISPTGDFDAIEVNGGNGSEIPNVQIRDLKIDRATGAAGRAAIDFNYADYAIIDSVTITGSDRSLYMIASDGVKVNNVDIFDFDTQAILSNGNDCEFTNILVDGQSLSKAITGAVIFTGRAHVTNMTIKNINTSVTGSNVVMLSTSSAIGSMFENLTIENGDMASATNSIFGFALGVSQTVINNCRITDIDNTTAANSRGLSIANDNCIVTNTTVTGCSGKGIVIDAGSDSTVFEACITRDNGADSGIDNTNQDNFYDTGTNTFTG